MRATRCYPLALAAHGCTLGALLWAAGCGSTGLPAGLPGSSREGQTADGGLVRGSTSGAPALPVAGTGPLTPPPPSGRPPMTGSAGARSMPPPSRDAGTSPTRDGGLAADGGMPRDAGFPQTDAGVFDAMPPRPCQGGQHSGDLYIYSQMELEGLRDCKHVDGNLIIQGEIVDLSPLSALSTVSGDFSIGGVYGQDPLQPPNTSLHSLKGLESLRSVGSLCLHSLANVPSLEPLSGLERARAIGVTDLDSLTNLNGLGKVSSWQNLTVRENAKLASLDGLSVPSQVFTIGLQRNPLLASIQALRPLQTLGDSLLLEELPALKSLDGLQSLQPGYAGLQLVGCNALTDLTGLGSFGTSSGISLNAELRSLAGVTNAPPSLGWISVTENPKLENLLGIVPSDHMLGGLSLVNLPSLKSLADLKTLTAIQELGLGALDALPDLSGLDALASAERLTISDCAKLQSLRGLGALQKLGSLVLESNIALTSLQGLEKLSELSELAVGGNLALVNFMGLSGLQSVVALHVSSNPALKNFQGAALRHAGDILVESNPLLTDFTGLENLMSVDSGFSIGSNSSLTSLHALSSLGSVGSMIIELNRRLPQCEIEWLAKRIMNAVQASDNGPPGMCPP